jgi:hypothetical protein
VLGILAWVVPAYVAAAEWRPLFNGRNLEEWIQRGGNSDYRVENGEIVGRSVPNTMNTFLCTTREYGDFILELEFKIDPRLNSGIQIRSKYSDVETFYEHGGQKRRIPADRVYGYQVEIDPSGKGLTAGVYDEARRGWLANLKDNEAARNAFRPGDWNRLRIEARGDSIRTWLNDVPAADVHDSMNASGFIALQIHAVDRKVTEPLEIRWRNLRIQELP